MARATKKTKAVTVATAENAATDAQIRSVGDVAMEVVGALPALEPIPDPDMTLEAETVADMESVAAEPVTGREIFILLNKLKKSPRNARKTPHIEALAASIAAKGLFQNRVVEPEVNEAGEATGWSSLI